MKLYPNNLKPRLKELHVHFTTHSHRVQGPYVILPEDQEKEINILKKLVNHEHFFFTVDIKNFKIVKAYGIEKWLGYPDGQFTLYDYYALLHPATADVHFLIAKFLIEKTCAGHFKLAPFKGSLVMHHAIKHRLGYYLLVKRIITPFQLNEKNQVTEYLNKFMLIGTYNNEPVTFRLVDTDPAYEMDLKKFMQENASDCLPFSEREFAVLKLVAGDHDAVAERIAILLNIEKNTVNTYKQRLLAKARDYTGLPFKDVAEVARFFKNQSML